MCPSQTIRDSALGTDTATSSDGPNLSAPENQIKRNGSCSLEGCGRGRIFQPFASLRGGRGDAQWPGSMSLWRTVPSPLTFLLPVHQRSLATWRPQLGLLLKALVCSTLGICFLTAMCSSQGPNFQYSHYPRLGFCLFLVNTLT